MPTRRPNEDPSSGGLPAAGARWLILTVPVPPRGEELLLVDALHRLGAHVVDRVGERFAAHFPAPLSVPSLLAETRLAVRASTSLEDPALEWRWQSHAEWLEGRPHAHHQQRVTERILVVISDSAADRAGVTDRAGASGVAGLAGGDAVPTGADIVIRLQPTTAFGTAEHPTTRACLALLEGLVRPGHHIADVGSGSGILAIAAVRLGAAHVLAVEADPVAAAAARSNVTLNGVEARVTVRQWTVRPGDGRRLGRPDLIVANLRADILGPLMPAFRAAIAAGGTLLVSGVLHPERDGLVAMAENARWTLRDQVADGGWWTGVFEAS